MTYNVFGGTLNIAQFNCVCEQQNSCWTKWPLA